MSIIVAFHFYFNIQIEDKEFGYLIYTISDIQKLCTPIFLEWKIKKAFRKDFESMKNQQIYLKNL